MKEIPDSVYVKRAFGLDTSRHFSVGGKHFQWMALPDRWVSWLIGAIPSGLLLIRKYLPSIVWSTYPVATAHLIAWLLNKITGIPWIADFRDPMVERNKNTGNWAPHNPTIRKARLFIEDKVVKNAVCLIFCTAGARQICIERYPYADHSKWIVIPNGYEESVFKYAESRAANSTYTSKKITLLHSGFLYLTSDRNPSHFFEALSSLKERGCVNGDSLSIVLRASGHDEEYQIMINDLGITDLVTLAPAVPYQDAIFEMLQVNGLLIFQGSTSNPAIPAKVYEYLRAKKPIFSLADEDGETAKLLKSMGQNYMAPLSDTNKIEEELLSFIQKINTGTYNIVAEDVLERYSREYEAKQLADVLDEVCAKR